jgi:hypothetical protein
MSGVNGNVIMSGCGDDNPDDERREAARDHTTSVPRGELTVMEAADDCVLKIDLFNGIRLGLIPPTRTH